ncbi:hypothetical protein AVEN_15468-1, partial [Araneus ventricosus]
MNLFQSGWSITPPPAITFPEGSRERVVMGKDHWTLYQAYIRRDLKTSTSLDRRQQPQTGFRP